MSQRLFPIADVTVDSWQNTPLFSRVDEDPFSDVDIINTVPANAFEYECELQLSSATDPLQSSGYSVRVRAQRGNAGLLQELQVTLVQTSTAIAQWTQALSDSLATYTLNLSGPQADSITNHADLRVRLRRLATAAANYINLSGVDMLIPDAGFAHLDTNPSGPGLLVVPAASGHYLTLSGAGIVRVAGIEQPGSGALVLGASGIEVHA